MGYYLAILLLVLPGFASRSIYSKLNHSQEPESEFRETIKSLGFNVLIMFLNLLCISAFGILNGVNVNDVPKLFNSIAFIVFFTVITAINMISVSFLVDLLSRFYYILINLVRENKGQNILLNCPSLSSYLCDGQQHLIAIEKGGKIVELPGILEKIETKDGEIRQFSIIGQEELKDIDFSDVEVVQRYYNFFDDDRVVVEYDMEKPKNINRKGVVTEIAIMVPCLLLLFGLGFVFKFFF